MASSLIHVIRDADAFFIDLRRPERRRLLHRFTSSGMPTPSLSIYAVRDADAFFIDLRHARA
jgi:hypothetical protein